MNRSLLRIFASLTFFAYSSAMATPATAAKRAGTKATASDSTGWENSLKVYTDAKSAFERGGMDAMIAKLPKDVFSKADLQYLREQPTSGRTLPTTSILANGDLLVVGEHNGSKTEVVVSIVNAATGQFAINGTKFYAKTSLEQNVNEVANILAEKKAWTPVNLFIEEAHAGAGAIIGTILVVIGGYLLLTKTKTGRRIIGKKEEIHDDVTDAVHDAGEKVKGKVD